MKSILALIAITFIFGCCNSDPRDNWKECQQSIHPDPIKGNYVAKTLGTVTMTNGDECKIEEVSLIYGNCRQRPGSNFKYDDTLQCKYCAADTSPVARRLLCKSGAVTMNTILFSPDKFHRELIY